MMQAVEPALNQQQQRFASKHEQGNLRPTTIKQTTAVIHHKRVKVRISCFQRECPILVIVVLFNSIDSILSHLIQRSKFSPSNFAESRELLPGARFLPSYPHIIRIFTPRRSCSSPGTTTPKRAWSSQDDLRWTHEESRWRNLPIKKLIKQHGRRWWW